MKSRERDVRTRVQDSLHHFPCQGILQQESIILELLVYLPLPLINGLLSSLLALGVGRSPRNAGGREPAAQPMLDQDRHRGIIEVIAEVNQIFGPLRYERRVVTQVNVTYR